ncbi:FAS1-like dehydratase domain-containing protein [Granulicoccus sp. GXG6511]|uniref:FAS1-like dehydratase domain-containing protein n=1 Tax=Granulicoccus sp. GXG6511 TaxID=3381351 RepID=UPI003D7DDBD2
MPISTEHAGRAYPPLHYRVTAGKIAEFADALGDENPAYRGDDAIAPPTFPVVLASWDAVFGDPELGLALNRTIHVEQKFAYARPLRADDHVTATLRIENVRVRGQVDMVTVATSIDTVDGEHVCTMTSSLFHTREEES